MSMSVTPPDNPPRIYALGVKHITYIINKNIQQATLFKSKWSSQTNKKKGTICQTWLVKQSLPCPHNILFIQI